MENTFKVAGLPKSQSRRPPALPLSFVPHLASVASLTAKFAAANRHPIASPSTQQQLPHLYQATPLLKTSHLAQSHNTNS
jgi:hypothetical protein